MKRWIFYLAVLAAAVAAAPSTGTDVAKLQPVQAIYLYMEEDQLAVQTDTGDLGRGSDLDAAFMDLKQTTAGTVFLDTADYLIVTKETAVFIPELYDDLRPACRICLSETDLELEAAVTYLEAHEPQRVLSDHRAGKTKMSRLMLEEGRMYLEEEDDRK